MVDTMQPVEQERFYPYVITVGMYMGLPFGLTYNFAGTVQSPYNPN